MVLSVVLKVAKACEINKIPAFQKWTCGGISKTRTKEQVPGQARVTDMGKIKPASVTGSLGDGS